VLAIALHALGRYGEAAASFDEALRLDPAVLEGRPAAQAVREAARRGEAWP
jgi:tetratricopeptide (TPR) repeat protein